MRNPLAGLKARVLWRTPDGSTAVQVEDPDDDVMVIVAPDGAMFEERICGVAGAREAWEAASPFNKMRVPDDAGRKVGTHLEPEPQDEPPAVVPEASSEAAADVADEVGVQTPPVADDVVRVARALAIQIWGMGLMPRAELASANDQCLAHAVHENWLVVDDRAIVRGGIDPRPATVTRIPNF